MAQGMLEMLLQVKTHSVSPNILRREASSVGGHLKGGFGSFGICLTAGGRVAVSLYAVLILHSDEIEGFRSTAHRCA